MTQARVSFTLLLPLSMLPKLESVPGVARVAHMQWFGGVWQENTPLFVFAVDPLRQARSLSGMEDARGAVESLRQHPAPR